MCVCVMCHKSQGILLVAIIGKVGDIYTDSLILRVSISMDMDIECVSVKTGLYSAN